LQDSLQGLFHFSEFFFTLVRNKNWSFYYKTKSSKTFDYGKIKTKTPPGSKKPARSQKVLDSGIGIGFGTNTPPVFPFVKRLKQSPPFSPAGNYWGS
jgi:hypothetical protein